MLGYQLPGLTKHVPPAGGGGYAGPTWVGCGAVAYTATGSTALSVAYPTGLAAGDILVLCVSRNNNTPATVTATGFTQITTLTTTPNPSMTYLWKVATGSESGSLSATVDSTSQKNAIMFAIRGANNTTPFGTNPATASNTTGDTDTTPAMPSATANSTNRLLVSQFIAKNADRFASASPTGESNGDWLFGFGGNNANGNGFATSVFYAQMATAATISGGDAAYGGTTASWDHRKVTMEFRT